MESVQLVCSAKNTDELCHEECLEEFFKLIKFKQRSSGPNVGFPCPMPSCKGIITKCVIPKTKHRIRKPPVVVVLPPMQIPKSVKKPRIRTPRTPRVPEQLPVPVPVPDDEIDVEELVALCLGRSYQKGQK